MKEVGVTVSTGRVEILSKLNVEIDLEISEEFSALIEYVSGPIFLLESNRSIIWRNLASLDQGFLDAVELKSNKLELTNKALNNDVQSLIEAVLRTGGVNAQHMDAGDGRSRWRLFAFRKAFVRIGSNQSFTTRHRILIFWQALPSERHETSRQPEVKLSPMERRLVGCIATGLTVRQASQQLNVSYHTARKYLQSVFVKTGSKRQTELVALACSWSPE